MKAICFAFCASICLAVPSSALEPSRSSQRVSMTPLAPALPQSDPTNPGAPDLLPESSALPSRKDSEIQTKVTRTNRLRSAKGKQEALSKHSSEKARKHFGKIRSLAMQSPHAEYLLERARHASTRAAKRKYLRRYNAAVRARMRSLDPDLRVSTIDLDRSSGIDRGVPKSGVHRPHHRSRTRPSHLHRRHRIYFDEDGPPEMGPYGPGPYGPPVMWPAPPGRM
jgi:hypothetical protein